MSAAAGSAMVLITVAVWLACCRLIQQAYRAFRGYIGRKPRT